MFMGAFIMVSDLVIEFLSVIAYIFVNMLNLIGRFFLWANEETTTYILYGILFAIAALIVFILIRRKRK